MARPSRALVVLRLLCVGCGSDPAAEVVDAAVSQVDSGAPDAAGAEALPLAGYGTLTGDCDELDTELTSAAPSVLRSAIAFDHEWTEAELGLLSPGGQEVITDGNAGGSSLLSEAFSYEVLYRCERATLLATETEVHYDGPGTITDLLVEIDGVKIGVSVTRAVAFPFEDPYTVEQADELLRKKLGGILESSGHVAAEDRWAKQVLAVLAYSPGHADALAQALAALEPTVLADTIVWIIVSDGADAFIY